MLAPKKTIIIYPYTHTVMFKREGKKGRFYHLGHHRLERLYCVLNKVINQLYGPRVELGIEIKVEW